MKTPLSLMLMLAATVAMAQNPLLIPDTLSGTSFQLNVEPGTMPFYPGFSTPTIGVNGSYLGPTLLLNKGDSIALHVHNGLNEATTLHWHGMHVAPQNDGGPHNEIAAGSTWSPSFTVRDRAAVYWYHSHLHMNTARQVTLGEAGMIIVRDPQEAALALPRRYGLDDFPLALQTRAFTAGKEFVSESALDSVVLVNGTRNPVLNVPAQVVRLRVLNATTERVFNVGFTGNLTFYQIGSDGGLLQQPVTLTRLWLAPGERAELLVDFSALNGQALELMSFGAELPTGIYGAANPAAIGNGIIPGYSSNGLNGSNFVLLKLQVSPPTANPVTAIPAALVPDTPVPAGAANLTRTLTFAPVQMGAQPMLNGPFTINGQAFDMNVINLQVPFNNTEIWQLTNNTAIAHPFHIHDVQFYVLDINGAAPPPSLQGRKDVVLVPSRQTLRFITRFETFHDPIMPFMYHCHMLTHEDYGMMGQFVVLPPVSGSAETKNAGLLQAYPNPVSQGLLKVRTQHLQGSRLQFSLTDMLGRQLRHWSVETAGNEAELPVQDLPAGVYLLRLLGPGEQTLRLVVGL